MANATTKHAAASAATEKRESLQILRGIAALCVVLYHTSLVFGPGSLIEATYRLNALMFGHAGVEIFFVLSGYIILHAHWGDQTSCSAFARYVRRRFSRIYPVTIVAVILLTILTPAMRLLTGDPIFMGVSPAAFITSITLVPASCNYIPATLWSLSNEMFFYLIFALYYVNRYGFIVAISGFTALVLSNAIFRFAPGLAECSSSPLNLYNSIFIIGVLCFFVSKVLLRRTPNRALAWSIIGAGLLVFSISAYVDVIYLSDSYFDARFIQDRKFKIVTHFLYGVAGAGFVLGASMLQWRPGGTAGRTLSYLGEASFSLYLLHVPIIGLVARLLQSSVNAKVLHPELAFLLIVAACVAAAIVFHRFIEIRLVNLFR